MKMEMDFRYITSMVKKDSNSYMEGLDLELLREYCMEMGKCLANHKAMQ